MFEHLIETFCQEMHLLSNGNLHCIAYSKALLNFFEIRGIAARPLVVRAVAFGYCDENSQDIRIHLPALARTAANSSNTNGCMQMQKTNSEGQTVGEFTIHYCTLGFGHGMPEGEISNNAWIGHMGVVADGIFIDLTIGQINSVKEKGEGTPMCKILF